MEIIINTISNNTFLWIIEVILLVTLGYLLYQIINIKKIRSIVKVRKQAFTDQLTGRGNRYLFISELDKLIEKKKKFAVCFMDLDGFKHINDTMGHDAGDKLLIYLANTFEKYLPKNATAYRLGGDEFSIIIKDIKTTDDVVKLIEYLKERFSKPIIIDKTEISLQYSLGISMFPEDATTRQELIMYADDAMYYIKENGKNGYYFHNKTLKARLDNKNKMELDLKRAYENGEFSISLQPRLNLENLDEICFEALLYWEHPVLGRLESNYFIKQADDMGIIIKLDQFVLESVCKKLNKLKSMGFKNVHMAVNISNRHVLKSDFYNKLCSILKENNIEKDDIYFELTKNIDIDKLNAYKDMLKTFKECGVKIIINNLEVKYDSIKLFKDLPIDEIKISSEYIKSDESIPEGCLKDIIKLCRKLEYKVIVCCIDDRIKLKTAIEYGANKLQGDLLYNKMYDKYIGENIKKYNNNIKRVDMIIEGLEK